MKIKHVLIAIISLGLLCSLFLPYSPAVSAADNLAVNGDLELGSTNGWNVDKAEINSSVVHGGSYSLKLTATSAYSGAAYKTVPVRKNATVTVSFWYRYDAKPTGTYHVYTYQGADTTGSTYSNADESFAVPTGCNSITTWQEISYTFNSGDYDSFTLKFCPGSSGCNQAVYIDDLVVTSEGGDEPDVAPYLTSFGTKYNRPVDAAYNVIQNGGFESTTNAQWNTSTFITGGISVAEDATAPEGTHSLCLSYTALSVPTWYYFPVTVEKNTEYAFSAWVKSPRLSNRNNATATFGVMGSTTSFLVYEPYNGNGVGSASLSTTKMQLMATSPDDEWHLRSVTFNSGSNTTVYIGVYGTRSYLYLDDIALYKLANGMEYISPLRSDTITAATNSGNKYCADGDSLVEGIYMTSNDAQLYWSENPAWRNGFLSFAESGDAHGTVLKYAQSAHTEWALHYIKWIDVQPGTDYTFTVDVKRLTAGGGRIALLDDNVLSPAELYTVSFNAADSDWVTHSVNFNSGVYSRIGICIVDGGGSALIDEVRLFETAKGIADNPALAPTLKPVNKGTGVMEMSGGAAEDLMLNGGFENGLEGWTANGDTALSDDAHSGSQAVLLSHSSAWGEALTRTVAVEKNTQYTLSFRVKRVSGSGVWHSFVLDASNWSALTAVDGQTWFNYTGSEWQTHSITVNSGERTSVMVKFCPESANAGTFLIDDVSLMPADSSAKLGVAFLFQQEGFRIYRDEQFKAVLDSATVIPYDDGETYTLLRMGAVVTNVATVGTDAEAMNLSAVNGNKVIDVPVVYLWSTTDTDCQYAVRVPNVPVSHSTTPIYARPYYVFEKDGAEIVVYGDIVSRSYAG